ncbi:MAG: TetR/AcrR family transcriptional regulator [Actinomycetia bacterium]|nr:TetR/AcrR family transcriptional regulator [Actinomycetes bacterium]
MTAGKLTAERAIEGAMALADRIGGMVDAVFAEIELPPTDHHWRPAILVRCHSMRQVLAQHPWAAPLMETRTTPGPATLRHHDAVLGCFRRAGFSLQLTGHAYAVVDAFLYGFALQETPLPATSGDDMAELAGSIAEQMPVDRYPHLTEFTADYILQPGYGFGREFDVGIQRFGDSVRGSDGLVVGIASVCGGPGQDDDLVPTLRNDSNLVVDDPVRFRPRSVQPAVRAAWPPPLLP